MKRSLFYLFGSAVLALSFFLTTSAWAQYIHPPHALQSVRVFGATSYSDVLAPPLAPPAGSQTADMSANLKDNTVTLQSGQVSYVVGAINTRSSSSANYAANSPEKNRVFIEGGVVTHDVVGGSHSTDGVFLLAQTAENTVTIKGGTILGDVYGGYSGHENDLGSCLAFKNHVIIEGGTIGRSIIAGQAACPYDDDTHSYFGGANDNIVTVKGMPTFYHVQGFPEGAHLVGGLVYQGAAIRPLRSLRNILNVHSVGLEVGVVHAFQILHFHLPQDIENGDTMLTVNTSAPGFIGGTDLTGVAEVKVGFSDPAAPPALTAGNEYILIDGAKGTFNTIEGTLDSGEAYAVGLVGDKLVMRIGEVADLAIEITPVEANYYVGDTVSYNIILTNNGPDATKGAAIEHGGAPGWLGPLAWSCVASAGAACPVPANGSGNYISLLAELDVGASVTISVSGEAIRSGELVALSANTALVGAGGGFWPPGTDPDVMNDQAIATLNIFDRREMDDATYSVGDTAADLWITASSDFGVISFQWYSGATNDFSAATPIAGETGRHYTPDTATAGTTYYWIVVTDDTFDFWTWDPIILETVIGPARIVVERTNAAMPIINEEGMEDASYFVGDTAEALWVEASSPDGGVISYQWYSSATDDFGDATQMAGEAGNSHTPDTSAAGTTYYWVVVTNTRAGVSGNETASETVGPARIVVRDVTPQTFEGVFSRKVHGSGAGPFVPYDLPIDPNGSLVAGEDITVEPRTGGEDGAFTVVFRFEHDVITASAATLTGGGASTNATTDVDGKEVIVNLTGVPDGARLGISLTVDGTVASANVGFLLGKVDDGYVVNQTDVTGVRTHVGATLSEDNFIYDLDVSGVINQSDVTSVRTSVGQFLQ